MEIGLGRAGVRRALGGVAFSIALASLAAAGPAASGKTFKSGPFRYVSSSVSTGANTGGGNISTCPSGSRLAGGGGAIGGPSDAVRIGSIAPFNSDLDGDEDDGYLTETYNNSASPVMTRSMAVCLGNGKGGSQLLYNRANGTTVNNGSSVGTGVSANCASGRLVGGGIRIPGNAITDNSERLNSSHPRDTNADRVASEGWSGKMNITNNNGFAITPTAYAVCLPTGPMKMRYVYKTKVVWPGTTAKLKTPCPKGFRVSGGGSQGFFTRIVASLPFDNKDKRKAPDNGWRVTVTNSPGGDPAALLAHAICLKPK